MRFWPIRRRQRRDQARELDEELDVAHREVDRALLDAERLRCRADDVGDRLAATRRRNHVREAVEWTMRRA